MVKVVVIIDGVTIAEVPVEGADVTKSANHLDPTIGPLAYKRST